MVIHRPREYWCGVLTRNLVCILIAHLPQAAGRGGDGGLPYLVFLCVADTLTVVNVALGTVNAVTAAQSRWSNLGFAVAVPSTSVACGIAAVLTSQPWAVGLFSPWLLLSPILVMPALLGVGRLAIFHRPFRRMLLGNLVNQFYGVDSAAKVAASLVLPAGTEKWMALALSAVHLLVNFTMMTQMMKSYLGTDVTRLLFFCFKSVLCDLPVGLLLLVSVGDSEVTGVKLTQVWIGIGFCVGSTLVSVRHMVDFYALSRSKDRETERLRSVIETAQGVAGALAQFDLVAAEALVEMDTQAPEALRAALQQQLANLRQYRPFLPHSLIGQQQDDAGSETESENELERTATNETRDAPDVVSIGSPAVASYSPGSRMSTSPRADASSCVSSGGRTSPLRLRRSNLGGIRSGSVSIVTVRMLVQRQDMSCSNFQETHAKLAVCAVEAVRDTRGVIERLGDRRILASWGGHSARTGRVAAAVGSCRFCLRFTSAHAKIATATVSGRALTAYVGCDELRGPVVSGWPKVLCSALSRLAGVLRCRAVVCGGTAQSAQHEYRSRRVDCVKYEAQRHEVHQLLGKNEANSEEWMYAMAANGAVAAADPVAGALEALVGGDLSAAQARLEPNGSTDDAVVRRLRVVVGTLSSRSSDFPARCDTGVRSGWVMPDTNMPLPYTGRRIFPPGPRTDFELFPGESARQAGEVDPHGIEPLQLSSSGLDEDGCALGSVVQPLPSFLSASSSGSRRLA
eukprot:TRINITY_DN2409_c0_g2_i1.p1 TRINITY_DN2409_c0_g2~~TRINITY_DN2409_c0_g2_i1.p1  ORF type:complete len:742 (+),score=204.91 TRINITY_DN2409_c0_g2_i1:70-2295(+)